LGMGRIGDYWASGEMTPFMDEQQDWTLVSATEVSGVTTITASRALTTGDAQDWDISALQQPSGQWIIAAIGTVDALSQHPSSGRIAVKVNLFAPSSAAEPMDAVKATPAIESLNFTVQNYAGSPLCDPVGTTRPGITTDGVTHVQTQCVDAVTDYSDFCFSFAANGFTDEAHAVAFEWLHTAENTDIIHHYVLYGHYSEDCNDGGAGSVQLGEHLGEWAPGVADFVAPSNAGYRIGGSEGFKSVALNVHYDNQPRRAFVDNSGVRLWLTRTLRTHDIGVLQLGDPTVTLRGVAIPAGVSKFEFLCKTTMPYELNVLYIQLHAHASGIKMETTQSDRDGLYKASHRTDYYDFNFQNFLQASEFNFATQTPSLTIAPGDQMHTACWYNNDGRAGPVNGHQFGLASNDEMCIVYVGYYPKVTGRDGSYCKSFDSGGLPFDTFLGSSTMDSQTSEDVFTNRSFGRPASLVASEGLFAGGIATITEAEASVRTTCDDSPTIGTIERLGELTCDELLDLFLIQQPSSSKSDVCSDFLGSTTIFSLKGLLSLLGLTYKQPRGYSDLEMAINICGQTCCELGVVSAGCPSDCPPSNNTVFTIGLAAGIGGGFLIAVIATVVFCKVRAKRAKARAAKRTIMPGL